MPVLDLTKKVEKKQKNERMQEAIREGQEAREKLREVKKRFEQLEQEFKADISKIVG